MAVWLFGMLQLHRIFSSTALVNDGNGSCIDSVHYDNATLLGITESFISCFNGRLNETEQFCFICSLLHLDNKHCSQLLDISESSVRSCRTRLKDKLQPVTLQLLYDDIP